MLFVVARNGVEQFEEIEEMDEPTAEVAEDFLRLGSRQLLSTTFGEFIITLSFVFSLDESVNTVVNLAFLVRCYKDGVSRLV